jgi:putative intracellular protease/amidase
VSAPWLATATTRCTAGNASPTGDSGRILTILGRLARRRRGSSAATLAGMIAVRRLAFRVIAYLLAALVPPVLVGGLVLHGRLMAGVAPVPAPRTLPQPPAHDPQLPTAVVLTGNTGAESIDVLAPYGVLAASGSFNVYTAAPRREPLNLFPGAPHLQGADLLPHYSFAELADVVPRPDLVVVPYIPGAGTGGDEAVLTQLRRYVADGARLLAICGGSYTAAQAGVLSGRRVTTHQSIFEIGDRDHPDVTWVRGQRWVEDGPVVSSAGITAAIDAALKVLERTGGRAAAERTARDLGYPHLRHLDDPTWTPPAANGWLRMLTGAFVWDTTDLGVLLADGVEELALSAVVDIHPRSLGTTVRTVADEHRVITSRHGLHLLPRHALADRLHLDRIVLPGEHRTAEAQPLVRAWERAAGLTVDRLHRANTFAVDAVLADIARHDSRVVARAAATGVEYPIDPEQLPGRSVPVELLLPPLLLGAAGVGALHALARWRRHRRAPRRR